VSRGERELTFAKRFFGMLLYALPGRFRRTYGAQMYSDFRDALRERRSGYGSLGAISFALGACADVFWTGLREYGGAVARDLLYTARSMLKAPLFSLVVVATLGVAIGANATAFSILRGVILAPLPYADASRLVSVTVAARGRPSGLSIPAFFDVSEQNRTLSSLAAYYPGGDHTFTDHGAARKVAGYVTSPNLFNVLGVRPLLGRPFRTVDARLGSPSVIVISYELWSAFFRRDATIIGKRVQADGVATRIIGVMPAGFKQPGAVDGFGRADFWMALQRADAVYVRSSHCASAVGRLRRGVTAEAAAADLKAIFARLKARYPMDDSPSAAVHVQPFQNALFGSVRPLLFAIVAAVGGVLLVACANVANLLLSRAAARDRELAIRAAVGASRRRIVAQLLTETFVFAACGGVLGFLLAYLAVGAFVALHPVNIPRAQEVTLDGMSALYTLGIIAFCTLGAGLAPAFTLSSHRVADGLKASGRGDVHRGARTRSTLAATEIALALAIVITAGLVVRSYLVLTHRTVGFNSNDVLVSEPVAMYGKRYKAEAAVLSFYGDAMRRVRAMPAVRSAEWADAAPFMGRTASLSFDIVGHRSDREELQTAGIGIVGPSFFRILSVPLVRGRTFRRSDGYAAARVVVVNAALAKMYFRERPALGAQISLKFPLGTAREVASKRPVVRTIIGVVGDTRDSYGRAGVPKMYLPFAQVPLSGLLLVARIAPHAHVANAIAGAVTAADSLLAAPKIQRLDDFLAADAAQARLSALTLLALAFVAFMLAIAGIYAVVSYGVARRTHEFGIRIAVGARAMDVLRDVLGGTLRTAAVGILVGIVLAAFAANAIADQLYGIGPFDPLTFALVVAAVTLASVAAALIPAWRAIRVDPMVALRYE